MYNFTLPDGTECYVVLPSIQQVNEAQDIYSVTFTQLLKQGHLLTQHEMDNILKERGIVREADQEKRKHLQQKLRELTSNRAAIKDKRLKEKLNKQIEELLTEIVSLETYRDFYDNTIEERANNARTSFLIQQTVYKKNGELLFPTIDDFLNLRDGETYTAIIQAYWQANANLLGTTNEENEES